MTAADIAAMPVSRRSTVRWNRVLFLFPILALLVFFFVLPLFELLRVSFQEHSSASHAARTPFTFANYARVLGDPMYWTMLANSLKIAFCTTFVTLVVGYAVAFYLIQARGWERTLIAVACLLPIFVNVIVGVLGWYILMLPFGVFQQMLAALGIVQGPLRWLKSDWALVAVLTYEHLPFAILILASSLQGVPTDKIAAARILGAPNWRIIWTVMLPLTMPGIVASAILIFSLSISSYLIPILIAGPQAQVIPTSIFSFANDLLNWNMAGALAFVLLLVVSLITYGFLAFMNRLTRRGQWEMV